MTEISSAVSTPTTQPTEFFLERNTTAFAIKAALEHLSAYYSTGETTRTNLSPQELELLAKQPTTTACVVDFQKVAALVSENQEMWIQIDAEEAEKEAAREAFLAKPIKELVQILEADAEEHSEALTVVDIGSIEWYAIRYHHETGFDFKPLCGGDWCNEEEAWRYLAATYYDELREE